MDFLNAMFVVMTFTFVAVPLMFKAIGASRLPESVLRLYAYGKITGGARPSGLLSVPKRWYRHFYVASAVLAALAAMAMDDAYRGAGPSWPAAAWSRRWLWDPIRRAEPSYSAATASVAVAMVVSQCFRRVYETHFVNEFSDTAVGLWYYASGYMHYLGAIATIMAEAPATPGPPFCASFAEAVRLAAGALLFAWAYREQWRANVALAASRKTDGRVTTHEHFVITGGLFELVSSPQMFTEVLLYGAWYVVLWGSSGWKYVLLFVWGNQFEIALISHRWYQDKFKDYPRNRKAIIPYLL